MKIRMKAPRGTQSATIEGCNYDVPASGIITLVSEAHEATLIRHGFTRSFVDDEEEIDLDNMSKAELITFIEERGGEADNDLKKAELKKIATKLLDA